MSRGDQREDIFLEEVDRHDSIKTLPEACQKPTGRFVHLNPEAREEFRQAWSIGGEASRQECLERMERKVGENHPGQTRLDVRCP